MWRRKRKPMPVATEATAARIRAEQDLEARLHDASRIRAVTAEWRRIRERNNFAAAIEASFREGRA